MAGIIDDLLVVANDILGVRDAIGAVIHPVYFVTRTWEGGLPGKGIRTEVRNQMLPSPQLVNLAKRVHPTEAGVTNSADIILRNVSKASYPDGATLRLETSGKGVERFYEVGGVLYTVTRLEESYITWHVHLRKVYT